MCFVMIERKVQSCCRVAPSGKEAKCTCMEARMLTVNFYILRKYRSDKESGINTGGEILTDMAETAHAVAGSTA